MIVVAAILYLLLVYRRNMREAALVGIWAFTAIAVRQWQQHNNISIAAIIASAVLLVAVSIHGYKNLNTAVFAKIKRGEWKL
jgi:hypothetical protein